MWKRPALGRGSALEGQFAIQVRPHFVHVTSQSIRPTMRATQCFRWKSVHWMMARARDSRALNVIEVRSPPLRGRVAGSTCR
jgi:hypothetical protein